jgi:hypothetical protein
VRKATEINPDITFIDIMGDQFNYGMARMLFGYTGKISWKIILVCTHKGLEKISPIKRRPV